MPPPPMPLSSKQLAHLVAIAAREREFAETKIFIFFNTHIVLTSNFISDESEYQNEIDASENKTSQKQNLKSWQKIWCFCMGI